VAAQRYRPAMLPVAIIGVERPALARALAERGLQLRAGVSGATAALIADDARRPICPIVVEARSADAASMLLDDGVDDVVLASDPDGLVAARLAALVRRTRPEMLRVGDLQIDTVERRVVRGGATLPLLPREYALLLYLARHAGEVVDHATLHHALWSRAFDPGTNVIAVHISRLRAKLGRGGVTVLTERGRGYRLAIVGTGQGG
jgi:two-component system, OmpR family, response regulator